MDFGAYLMQSKFGRYEGLFILILRHVYGVILIMFELSTLLIVVMLMF